MTSDRPKRKQQADYRPAPDRDPLAVLERQAADRVPELNPVRYGRMLPSPLAFYRGAAAVMATDLAPLPHSGLTTQLCGDAHVLNFGLYASPERHLVFDLNDFDETAAGPFEWDVKRLATSLVLAEPDPAIAPRRSAAYRMVERYRRAMRAFAAQGYLAVWYARADVDDATQQWLVPLGKRVRRSIADEAARARRHTSAQAALKLTTKAGGTRRFRSESLVVEPLMGHEQVATAAAGYLQDLYARYQRSVPRHVGVLLDNFDVVDLARKVVGVGSVGTRCYVVLLRGRDDSDWLILQVKEAQRSVLREYGGLPGPEPAPSEGERVVEGQRLMQAVSDVFLGWIGADDLDGAGRRDFYVRQLRDWKGGPDVATLSAADLGRYAELCGWALARAHARAGDRHAIARYLGADDTFARAVTDFARAYAEQTVSDHAALVAAVQAATITARTGA